MFAVTVTFEIHPDQMGHFLPLMHANASASLDSEPGCRQFDVATDPSRPNAVFLYELYETEADFHKHLSLPHFLSFAEKTDPMIASKAVTTWSEVRQ
ncbi:putative quinol monooxygenase [uncultured Roseobacter sp.]|uniref:putative quinol monooxygenase n=1 Tax=uncultured Roseobacter sp. TaxID=114847 RepID=UPI00260E27B4|nr:putative quinol monooxygenase [uncultured Roseobacter sp.]